MHHVPLVCVECVEKKRRNGTGRERRRKVSKSKIEVISMDELRKPAH